MECEEVAGSEARKHKSDCGLGKHVPFPQEFGNCTCRGMRYADGGRWIDEEGGV